MTDAELAGLLGFLRAAGRLKDTLRSGHTPAGRPESVAEHSWRLCLMAVALGPAAPDIDMGRVLKILVVHDLGEAIAGDVPAIAQGPDDGGARARRERADLAAISASLPPATAAEILGLWDEYAARATPEARFAKALDKLETLLTHGEGANPPDFDYAFNLTYGARDTGAHPLTGRLRALLDEATRARMAAG